MTTPPPDAGPLEWRDLAAFERSLLARKLEGVYNFASDAVAFDALATDKQQALLIFARRFDAYGLWRYIRRVANIYGLGGVGMNFEAWPGLYAALRRHANFHHRFTPASFREKKRRRAALHLRRDLMSAPRWSAHFDDHNPLHSPAEAWHHCYREAYLRHTPCWQDIDKALRDG